MQLPPKPFLDLWCGRKTAGAAWAEDGHPIISVDNDPGHNPTICADILDVTADQLNALAPYGFEFAWASVDCAIYSLMNLHSGHWIKEGEWAIAQTTEAHNHNLRVKHTIALLEAIDCPHWIIENPRAMLRKQKFMARHYRVTVSYCKYGDDRMKATDLWGKIPCYFEPLMCENGNPDHRPAPRGSRTGTQGMEKQEAGMIPYGLSRALRVAQNCSDKRNLSFLDDAADELQQTLREWGVIENE